MSSRATVPGAMDSPVLRAEIGRLCRHYGWDPDELSQEVALELLQAPPGQTQSFYLSRALWRVCKWARGQRRLERRTATRSDDKLVRMIDGGHCLRVWR